MLRGLIRWFGIMAVLACLTAVGCKSVDPGGPGFAPDPLYDSSRKLRQPDADNELAGVSAKARQIERDCGIR